MNHKGTVTLETERLILRRFTMDDAEAMFRNWASDDEVTKFLTWPTHTNVSVSKAVINSWLDLYQKSNHYSWTIVLKELGEPIGSTAAVKQDDNIKMVHVGYCIGRNWWHKGYTSEALNRLVEFFFEEVGVHRIESRHDPRNPNSGKVMQKAGLQFEGIMRKSDQNNQGGYCDAAYYAILAEDYFSSVNKAETVYDKLVRDNIPAIIRAQGNTPVTRNLENDEYLAALNKKLTEEVKEYLDDKSIGEICDMLEVIDAICVANGITTDRIASLRNKKRNKNGAFDKRIWLEKVIQGEMSV